MLGDAALHAQHDRVADEGHDGDQAADAEPARKPTVPIMSLAICAINVFSVAVIVGSLSGPEHLVDGFGDRLEPARGIADRNIELSHDAELACPASWMKSSEAKAYCRPEVLLNG